MGITAYIARENAFYLAISFFIFSTILNVLRNFSLLEWNCVVMRVCVFVHECSCLFTKFSPFLIKMK